LRRGAVRAIVELLKFTALFQAAPAGRPLFCVGCGGAQVVDEDFDFRRSPRELSVANQPRRGKFTRMHKPPDMNRREVGDFRDLIRSKQLPVGHLVRKFDVFGFLGLAPQLLKRRFRHAIHPVSRAKRGRVSGCLTRHRGELNFWFVHMLCVSAGRGHFVGYAEMTDQHTPMFQGKQRHFRCHWRIFASEMRSKGLFVR